MGVLVGVLLGVGVLVDVGLRVIVGVLDGLKVAVGFAACVWAIAVLMASAEGAHAARITMQSVRTIHILFMMSTFLQ